MWFMLPCTKTTTKTCQSALYHQYKIAGILDIRLLQQPSKQTTKTCQSALYRQHKIAGILDIRLLQQPSKQTLGIEKYLTQGI